MMASGRRVGSALGSVVCAAAVCATVSPSNTSVGPAQSPNDVMIWVVAKNNGTTEGWAAASGWLLAQRRAFTKVSTQAYYVDPGATGALGSVPKAHDFLQTLRADGVKTVAWVVPIWTDPALPWQPLNKSKYNSNLQLVLDSPEPFVAALKADVQTRNLSGVNFDFEQWYGNSSTDPGGAHGAAMRLKYINFLRLAGTELGEVGVKVSADLGSDPGDYIHTPLADFKGVPLQPAITMSTYALKFIPGGGVYHDFDSDVQDVVRTFGAGNAGVGLCNCNNGNVTAAMLDQAFAAIVKAGVTEVDWFALVTRGDEIQVGPEQMGGDIFVQHLERFLSIN